MLHSAHGLQPLEPFAPHRRVRVDAEPATVEQELAEEVGGLVGAVVLAGLAAAAAGEPQVGLVINDPQSYWHLDAGDGSWKPKVGAQPIESMEDMLTFAGVLN